MILLPPDQPKRLPVHYKHGQAKYLDIKLPDSKLFYIKFVYDITTDLWSAVASSEALEDISDYYGMIRDGEHNVQN